MTPLFELIADGNDITTLVQDKIKSLSIVDEAGVSADRFKLQLDNRDKRFVIPRYGAQLQIALGSVVRGQRRLYSQGRFSLDEVCVSSPPRLLSLSGAAADFTQQIKASKTRTWQAMSIGQIVRAIAAEHGLQPRVSADLSSVPIPQAHQNSESDLNFLTRLAQDYDALAKPTNGFLLFVRRDEATSASGQPLPALPILEQQCRHYAVAVAERDQYASATAYYTEREMGIRTPVNAGTGEPNSQLPRHMASRAQAQAAATSHLAALNRSRGQGRLVLSPWRPEIGAESRLDLSDLDLGFSETLWQVVRAEHQVQAETSTTLEVIASKQ